VLSEFDALERDGKFRNSYGRALVLHPVLGDRTMLPLAQRALDERSHWLIWLKLDPGGIACVTKNGFKELVKKVGFAGVKTQRGFSIRGDHMVHKIEGNN